jgi:hypothetical protein
MFFNGSLFWFLMGVVTVFVGATFLSFARQRGWVITWWKGLLALFWYAILGASFYAWGTLVGEGEASAGLVVFLLGLFVSIVLGAGLLRLLARKPRVS